MPIPELFSPRPDKVASRPHGFLLEREARNHPALLVDLSPLDHPNQWVDLSAWLRVVAPACLDASVLSLSVCLHDDEEGIPGRNWLLQARTLKDPQGDIRRLYEWRPDDERQPDPWGPGCHWPDDPEALLRTLLARLESWPWAATLGLCSPSHIARIEGDDSLTRHCDDLQAELNSTNAVVSGVAQWLAQACERDAPALRKAWLSRQVSHWKSLNSPDESEPDAWAFLGLLADVGSDHGLYEFGLSQLRGELEMALARMPPLQRVLLIGHQLGGAREMEDHLREARLDREDLSMVQTDALDDLIQGAAQELTQRAGEDHVSD